MMFDGAVAATVAEAPAADAATPDAPSGAADQAGHDYAQAGPVAEATGNRKEVVFVDGAVDDYQSLVSGMDESVEVVVLDRARDGVEQMAKWAQGRSGYDAIHVISNGSEGRTKLGTAELDAKSVANYARALGQLGAALTADGDILLYGSEIGRDARGGELLAGIANATGADVAASNDATGAAAAGGNGALEIHFGNVTTPSAIRAEDWDAFGGLLTESVSPLVDSGTRNVEFQVGDFDGDGDVDILTQEGGPGAAVALWRNDGSGGFTYSQAIADGVSGLSLASGSARVTDLDNDGDLDYHQQNAFAGNDLYFANNGAGVFTAATLPFADSGTRNPAHTQVGDFDNQGGVDVLTQAGGQGAAVTLWTSNGSGGFSSSLAIPAGVSDLNLSLSSVRVADFDNDGDLDVYQPVAGDDNDLYFTNFGHGIFLAGTPPLEDSGTTNVGFIQVGDLDNDGDSDILTQEDGVDAAVTLWSNNGNGAFTPSQAFAAGVAGLNIASGSARIADYDGDGDLDYYQRNPGAGNDLYLRNDGQLDKELASAERGSAEQGPRGLQGAPTLGQQLQGMHEGEQRLVRDLAEAFGQIGVDLR
ncbi:DUF4347 domain-containing protein [Metapseudomonas resinovorans]|nr:DUF4347 domain-containing protein [Pseudomonas resinovorans]